LLEWDAALDDILEAVITISDEEASASALNSSPLTEIDINKPKLAIPI